MTDRLLDRITYTPDHDPLSTIPWPAGLAPTAAPSIPDYTGSLPNTDTLVVFWTSAEAEALADVFTPGVPVDNWLPYKKNWDVYLPQLSDRSPAKDAGCMAYWHMSQVGGKRVLAVKSNLHLATDGLSAPIVQLWRQMVADIQSSPPMGHTHQPLLVITGGTAGGISADTQVGDVFVVGNAKFNCARTFKGKPWAQQRFTTGLQVDGNIAGLWPALTAPNAGRLRPVATRDPLLTFGGDVETVDYFGFADTDDSYGIVADDPLAVVEEMDDATLPLALSSVTNPPDWVSVRTASDPCVPSAVGDLQDQAAWASRIYEKYGYWSAVGAAIGAWIVITSTSDQPGAALEERAA